MGPLARISPVSSALLRFFSFSLSLSPVHPLLLILFRLSAAIFALITTPYPSYVSICFCFCLVVWLVVCLVFFFFFFFFFFCWVGVWGRWGFFYPLTSPLDRIQCDTMQGSRLGRRLPTDQAPKLTRIPALPAAPVSWCLDPLCIPGQSSIPATI